MARRLLAACLLGTLVLSGCGGSPSEEPTKTTSPSPTKTTPVVPELPEVAEANTEEGAIQFVRHYVELINHLQATGDVAPLRDASSPECESCSSMLDRAVEIYGSGGKVTGGDWVVDGDPIATRKPSIDGWAVDFVVTFEGQEVVEGQPQKTTHLKGGSLPVSFFVRRGKHGWVLEDWTRAR